MISGVSHVVLESLIHTPIVIRLSDPWELGEVLGWQELRAVIIDVETATDKLYRSQQEMAIVRLDDPFVFRNTSCEYFVASPRHRGSSLSRLASGQSVFCGITQIPEEKAHSRDAFNLSKWRGGIAAIATLEASSRT
jgi:hypothetical protein